MHDEFAAPRVQLDLQAASLGGAHCDEMRHRFGVGEECHQITVSMTNNNEKRDADTNQLWWSARTKAGGVYDATATVGPDRVAPGGNSDVIVLFAAPSGNVFSEVRYGLRWADNTAAAEIEPYR